MGEERDRHHKTVRNVVIERMRKGGRAKFGPEEKPSLPRGI